MKKKWIGLLLALVICIGLLPTVGLQAFAAKQAEDTVKVYITVSNDGAPVIGNDDAGTVLADTPVEVPYFDLANYGLGAYTRTDDAGQPLEEPTVLHLYIYVMEKYYLNTPENEIGTGASKLCQADSVDSCDVLGKKVSKAGTKAFAASGSAGSLFMTSFWGHDCNLMYFVNHAYPLQSAGWGATADIITLKDNDVVDVAMFTDWNFYNDGAFANFDQDTYTAGLGENLQFKLRGVSTSAGFDSGNTGDVDYYGKMVMYCVPEKDLADVSSWKEVKATALGNGQYQFTVPQTAGKYYLIARDSNWGTSDACNAPAVSLLNVAQSREVTVKVAPTTAEVTFYADENAKTELKTYTDDGIVGDYHQYTLTVPDGIYSYRAKDGETDLGGMAFEVPVKEEILSSGLPSGAGQTMTLVRANFYTTNSAIAAVGDYDMRIVAGAEFEVTTGAQYLDANNRVVTPAMVYAHGNGLLYNWFVTLKGEAAETYGVTPSVNQTFADTLKATVNKTFSLSALIKYSITAPKDAEVQAFYQLSYYNNEERELTLESTDDTAGTATYTFMAPSSSNNTYRVSKEGEVTQAGYLSKDPVTVAFPEDRTPSDTTSIAQTDALQSRMENSVLLNIDDTKDTNELCMEVGQTTRVRGFRAAWEIVNSDTGNVIIQPDFHYAVLSGADVIRVAPVTDRCTGNASGNWMDVTALKEGTAVVAVYYDAVDIGGNTSYKGTYGATDPARYGVFVVHVGKDTTITWNPVSEDGDWDAEFDTVYYFGENGVFTFAPEGTVNEVQVTNVYGKTMGQAAAVSANEDGTYAVPVKNGANIIAVTTPDGTDYMVVRAKQITYTITNNTTEESATDAALLEITQGDSITIDFEGMYMPVPKMAGIYNPGFGGTAKTTYTLNDAHTLTSAGAQYNFITKTAITFIAYESGECKLSGGHVSLTSMGDTFGNHRNMTDSGRGANFNAANRAGLFCSLPEIRFTVQESAQQPVVDTSLSSVKIYSGSSSYLTGFNITSKNNNTAYNWTKTTAQMENYYLGALVKANSYYTDLELTYWYEGEEKQTLSLASGVETMVETFDSNADKLLNLELRVTAKNDPSNATVLSYLVYPGSKNLKYVHPVIKTLTVTDKDGNTLPLRSAGGDGVQLTNTAYTLALGSDVTTLNLSAGMLQKYTNATNMTQDMSDTVTIAKVKDGVAGEATTVQAGGSYPAGAWNLENYDVSDADALQITVTSYVDGETSRIYTIDLRKAVKAKVDFISQMCGAFLHAPQFGVEVASDLAESYGYTDGVDQTTAVSVLDVLVRAHELVYGEDFTVETCTDYLTMRYNSPTKQFGEAPHADYTFYGGFFYNRAMANDGTKYDANNYNGTTVGTQPVADGDLVEFFFYEDPYMGDTYNWFCDDNGYARSFNAEQNVGLKLSVKGFFAMSSSCFKDSAEMVASDKALTISDAQLYLVDLETGALTEMDNAVTDENGAVTLRFAEPGTYTIAAYGTEDSTFMQLLTLTTIHVKAHTHDFGEEWQYDEAQHYHVCACGEKRDEAAHTYTEEVTQAASCEAAGIKTFTCLCGKNYTEEIPALGHAYSQTDRVEPTETKPGYVEYTCSHCQDTYRETIAELGCPASRFEDVDLSRWYHKGIDYALEEGYMRGTSETLFRPDDTLTRGQLVTILYRMEGEPEVTSENPFSDVPAGKFYTKAVCWAAETGVVDGFPDGTFRPDQVITREQIAKMLYEYAGSPEATEDHLTDFADGQTVSNYAKQPMNWAVGEGLIQGLATKLDPKGDATRAQIATIIMRFDAMQ